jgi:hypothetical protein
MERDGRFVGQCYRCKSEIWLPIALYTACKHSPRHSFFCPYGHEQIFAEGEPEEAKLRRERDRLKQQLAEKDDTIQFWIRQTDEGRKALTAERKVLRKIRTRIAGGVCPCCNRTFARLTAHMKTKHPEFRAEAAA